MNAAYDEFLQRKQFVPVISGHNVELDDLNPHLFDFQRVIVRWALRRGRAAIFADTGLGKTLMQTSWARSVMDHTGGDVLIVAPLCVAQQTVREGIKFGIDIHFCRDQENAKPGINITNYEMLDRFNLDDYHGIVLDESSIIKNRDGKTRNAIISACQQVPYRLSCTATPSPNDFMELGNQAEFLGIMNMAEMLAMFFINDAGDTGTWILKGHGKAKFWEWLSTWACVIRSPSDIGFDGSDYVLPTLNMFDHVVKSEATDGLFADIACGLMDRNKARKESIDDRVEKVYSVITSNFRDKLPTIDFIGDGHGVETGISGCSGRTGEIESGNTGKTSSNGAGESCLEQGEEERLYQGISIKQSGEVETESGATGSSECEAQGEICERSGLQGKHQGESEGVSREQSTCEKENSDKGRIQFDSRSVSPNVRGLQSSMPDLRVCGQGSQNEISSDRSLPQFKQSAGNIVHELQSGTGEVYGRSGVAKEGCSLSGKPFWFIWCHRNEEQEKLEEFFGDDCFSVSGSDSTEEKEHKILAWIDGERPVMISKPKIMGSGLNFQHCHNTAFVGLSDSWEQYYQAIRRFYRFGQTKEVNVHVISAESEGAVVANIKRKEEQNATMGAEMVKFMSESMKKEIFGAVQEKTEYVRQVTETPAWTIHNADCIDLSKEISDDSIDFTIYSPPFESLFTYSNSDRDMGNNKSSDDFRLHYGFLIEQNYRIMRPGRLVAVHCMNLTTSKANDGYIGLRDFRGDIIRAHLKAGFIYHSEVCIWKDPVVAMQRTKALGLLHKTIKKDSSMSRQGLADYLVVFRKPGQNEKYISHTADEFPVQMWQRYASPVWFDIDQSRTLNFRDAREEDDVKHICPLQLDVIERAMTLWTAPDDLVFSPFTGVGSEGYTAVKMGRRFIGSELKQSYYEQAVKNMATAKRDTEDLFA